MRALLVAVAAMLALPAGASAAPCALFPRSWPLNQRVDRLPRLAGSDAIVASMGRDTGVHPDFGTRYGIPYQTVGRRTPRRRLAFSYAAESDRVRYPLPRRPRVEAGADRHVLLWDRGRCRLYELFDFRRAGDRLLAGSGARWNLRSARMRPRGWTSADAAGLPILPLLAREPEVRRGRIRHALRVTAARTRRGFLYPARHAASDADDPALPRMGERLRLKASVDLHGLPRQARVVARAMQRYGLVVADNGANWFVTGAPSRRWDDDGLHRLGELRGSDFEAVDASALAPKGER